MIKSRIDKGLEILPANVGANVGRPGHAKRVHVVFIFELVCNVATVLTPAAGHNDIVTTVGPSVAVEQIDEFTFPIFPIQATLEIREIAGAADAVFIKGNARSLIGNGAAFAKCYFGWEIVFICYIVILHGKHDRTFSVFEGELSAKSEAGLNERNISRAPDRQARFFLDGTETPRCCLARR